MIYLDSTLSIELIETAPVDTSKNQNPEQGDCGIFCTVLPLIYSIICIINCLIRCIDYARVLKTSIWI